MTGSRNRVVSVSGSEIILCQELIPVHKIETGDG